MDFRGNLTAVVGYNNMIESNVGLCNDVTLYYKILKY